MSDLQLSSTQVDHQPGSPWPRFLLFAAVNFVVLSLVSMAPVLLLPEESPFLLVSVTGALALTHLAMLYFLGLRPGWLTLETLGLRPLRWEWRWLWIGIGVSLLFIPVRALLGLVFEWLVAGNLDSVNARSELFTSGGESFGSFVLAFLSIAVLIPIAEELFFRGVLHSWLLRFNLGFWVRVLASSVVFALFHIDSLGVIASSFVLGLITAVAYERTKSLATPIIIHFTTNAFAVVLMYLAIWLADLVPA